MELLIYKDLDELVHALAKEIKKSSEEAIAARGQFHFVLSGGSSPRAIYQLLASPPYRDSIDWKNIYFYFGDERFVPENDPQRNSLMAEQTLFSPLKIKDDHIYKVDATLSPEEAAKKYSDAIKTHFKNGPVKFDFILLGLGDDAHTASLFPNTSVLRESAAMVKSEFIKEMDTHRITMTAPLINQARNIAFLVFGEGKADAVYNVLKNKKGSPNEYPARLINMKKLNLKWFLDTAAASKL